MINFHVTIASCGTPKTHNSVIYSSYSSTLEGATVSFWCIDMNEEFISVCLKNASWIPDPVSHCADTTRQEYISIESMQLPGTAFLHIDVTSSSANPISGGVVITVAV